MDMEKEKVLLVDDDLNFARITVMILQDAGYEVFFQNTLFGIESIITKLSPNIIILDVKVGEEDSLERINDIQLAAEDIPIIFISSLKGNEWKTDAARSGAVIYLEKPFEMEVLLAWIKRYAKHDGLDNSFQVNVGDYTIETETHVLSYCGKKEKILSNSEFAAFKLLWTNKGYTVTRQDLKASVWNGAFCSDESLNNVIYHLRKSFERDASIHVDTIRGEGFRMWQDVNTEMPIFEGLPPSR